MQLPLGVADPYFVGELALEMNMPIGELGYRMSNWELTVFWPCFYEARRDFQQWQADRQGQA